MIGAGYVGLVSGACFSDFGHHVVCIDSNVEKVASLNHGEMPIHEPGLGELVKRNVQQGRLAFASDLKSAVSDADVVFIAVGTPSRRGDGHADLSHVYAAAREIAGAVPGQAVVVTKSTVPVGTGDEVERIIREENPDARVAVVSNPEFLREGAAIRDFKHPDRIVIGTEDPRARSVMAEVYRPLHLNASPILYTDRRTAELTKYAANSFLATKIAFINEIADLAEKSGRQREGSRARHRPRQPDRAEIPARRAGLRRILLSEGCDGADQDGAGQRITDAHRGDRGRGQRPA
jgi:UDPglucose 6-dehydrogenase